jgi:hypothetical protein
MKATFLILFLCVAIDCPAELPKSAGEPPSEWKSVLREGAQQLWDWCFDDGHFHATRLIGTFRGLGSQHDGDRQYEVARLLAQVSDDPHDALRYYLQSPDPYDRVFVIQVIAHLGDRRFIPILEPLTKDAASTKRWDILAYDSVGGGALRALENLRGGTNLVTPDTPLPKWLAAARQPNSQ